MMSGKEMADIYIDAYKEALDRFYGLDAATQIAYACLLAATTIESQTQPKVAQIMLLLEKAAKSAGTKHTHKQDAQKNPKKEDKPEDKKPEDEGGDVK